MSVFGSETRNFDTTRPKGITKSILGFGPAIVAQRRHLINRVNESKNQNVSEIFLVVNLDCLEDEYPKSGVSKAERHKFRDGEIIQAGANVSGWIGKEDFVVRLFAYEIMKGEIRSYEFLKKKDVKVKSVKKNNAKK